jgi:hypothetical protein
MGLTGRKYVSASGGNGVLTCSRTLFRGAHVTEALGEKLWGGYAEGRSDLANYIETATRSTSQGPPNCLAADACAFGECFDSIRLSLDGREGDLY